MMIRESDLLFGPPCMCTYGNQVYTCSAAFRRFNAYNW